MSSILASCALKPATCSRRVLISCVRLSRRSEEHTSELQSPCNLVCRLLLEKKKTRSSRVDEVDRLVALGAVAGAEDAHLRRSVTVGDGHDHAIVLLVHVVENVQQFVRLRD